MKKVFEITSLIFAISCLIGCAEQTKITKIAKEPSQVVWNVKGPYEPTWESLSIHPQPEWFEDAKFGMFLDWGLYSVPGWAPRKAQGPTYPDWYLYCMYYPQSMHPETIEYHKKTWGANFQRDDFIPLFTASEYDPKSIIQLAETAGMKYVIPFCKHHDGFCLWDSSFTHRDAVDMGPKRDLILPLVQECRKRGLKFGFYFSLDEWEYPVIGEDGQKMVRLWNGEPKLVPFDEEKFKGKITCKIPVRDFYGQYILPQAKEFIDVYSPDILWFDGQWKVSAKQRRTKELMAYFYNKMYGNKEVVINDRLGEETRLKQNYGDFYTSEYHNITTLTKKKWEECRSIGQSYGYNREDTEENVLSSEELIHKLINIVCCNGNFLLMVSPTGPGTVPELQITRLKDMGEWLKVNGSAIYATRPYSITEEGDTRFTKSKDGKYVYAICLKWPSKTFTSAALRPKKNSRIVMLGYKNMLGLEKSLKWQQSNEQLTVEIPDELQKPQNRPCRHAYVLRIETAG